jgi:hypothetical protein
MKAIFRLRSTIVIHTLLPRKAGRGKVTVIRIVGFESGFEKNPYAHSPFQVSIGDGRCRTPCGPNEISTRKLSDKIEVLRVFALYKSGIIAAIIHVAMDTPSLDIQIPDGQ